MHSVHVSHLHISDFGCVDVQMCNFYSNVQCDNLGPKVQRDGVVVVKLLLWVRHVSCQTQLTFPEARSLAKGWEVGLLLRLGVSRATSNCHGPGSIFARE